MCEIHGSLTLINITENLAKQEEHKSYKSCLFGMTQCARQTYCQCRNNFKAKWDPFQGSEGSSKKINNIRIKLNTPITSKFFTGFWFINATIRHSLKKKS